MRASHLAVGVLLVALGGAGVATAFTGLESTALAPPLGGEPQDATRSATPGEAEAILEAAEESARGGARHAPVPGFEDIGASLDLGQAGAFALVLGVGLVAAFGALFFLGRTRYVTREDVLENDVRRRIYEYVRAEVGANLKQITTGLALTTTNAIWHLRKLEDAGLIRSRRFNGFKIFYPADGGIEARRLSVSVTALSNGNAQEVLEYVVARPGAHQREIARALGVNHGTVRWHLKKLRSAELLTELKKGKTSAYYTTDTGLAALEHVGRREPEASPSAATPVAQY